MSSWKDVTKDIRRRKIEDWNVVTEIFDIIKMAPKTISIQDPVAKLYPFMMAAIGEEPSLNMITCTCTCSLLRTETSPDPVAALGEFL